MKTIALQHHEQSLFDNSGSYISGMRLFYAHFKEIPCIIILKEISGKRIKEFMEESQKDEILRCYKKQQVNKGEKKIGSINHIYCMKDHVMIDLEADDITILYPHDKESLAIQWAEKFKKLNSKVRTKKTTKISLIRQTNFGLLTSELPLKKPTVDLLRNYNDDLLPMHEVILKSLRQQDKSGIILLHGEPGTGKSTYIRHVIYQQKKKVIFLPAKMASVMESPHFTDFLISHANSIFVIEDAEQLIVSRENNYNSNISMLLNMTDGLLGESLGIQVIATFNTHIRNIDKALLRKGRLIATYEFKPLCIEKARMLAAKIGCKHVITKEMTLAEIYNYDGTELNHVQERNKIGFASSIN